MGIFDKGKKAIINSRRLEEKLYEVALEEVENDEIRKGLYSKIISIAFDRRLRFSVFLILVPQHDLLIMK